MADTTDVVTTPGSGMDPGVVRRFPSLRSAPKPVRSLARYAGIIPFVAYIAIFLIVPLIAIVVGSFQNPQTNAFTWSNVNTAVHGSYLHGFEQSLILSFIASVIPGVFGLLIAYAI